MVVSRLILQSGLTLLSTTSQADKNLAASKLETEDNEITLYYMVIKFLSGLICNQMTNSRFELLIPLYGTKEHPRPHNPREFKI